MSTQLTGREQEAGSLLDLIGNTPLLRLKKFERPFPSVEI
jgi:hypothetical protein